jgi:hypothetical protein
MQERTVTSMQIRAARGALNWSIQDLSRNTGVPTATLVRYEGSNGSPKSRKGHLETVVATLESAGIEFIGTPEDGPGIRLRARS